VLALALWNERDAILKERMFGLTSNEANHREEYPQREYPHRGQIETNR
jgi:hypothetical protein